jgi:hypothetical protein
LVRPDLAPVGGGGDDDAWISVVFRSDRIYRHKILRLNYTTYDVRRDEDVVHAGTSHNNVMVLNSDEGSADQHPYWYGRVLGIFHANVIYLGEGTTDFSPRRLDFIWVRWFTTASGGDSLPSGIMDCVQFPPMADDDSFGFLDPADVLRSCHLIPRFSRGQVHLDSVGLSFWAQDAKDWRVYCVNR